MPDLTVLACDLAPYQLKEKELLSQTDGDETEVKAFTIALFMDKNF